MKIKKHFRNSGTVNSGRAVVEPPQVQIESTIFEYNKSLSSTSSKEQFQPSKKFFFTRCRQGVSQEGPDHAGADRAGRGGLTRGRRTKEVCRGFARCSRHTNAGGA